MRSSHHAAPLQPGDVLGGTYVVRELIGAGGMGRVYRARQLALQRDVALKVLRADVAVDDALVARFHAEAVAGARLTHPDAVTVIDHGETDAGLPFLVMELVQGVSLTRLVRRDGPLPLRRVIELTLQVLSLLGEAHAAGIVHGDVKSDNVLVERRRDGSERVRLLDFGLARVVGAAGVGAATVGVPPTIAGTPAYMAPEVIRGGAPTPAADIYASGVLLFELLTATLPFRGATPQAIMRGHLYEVSVPPSARRSPALPRAVDELVMRALAKDPARRFASAADLAAALRHHQDARLLRATGSTTHELRPFAAAPCPPGPDG